jgi:hypothetical protein
MLEQDDVDVEATENPCGACVVTSNSLSDRGGEPGALRARGLVYDHDLLDPVDFVEAEERRANVGRKRADATRSRRIGGDDRGAQVPASLP